MDYQSGGGGARGCFPCERDSHFLPPLPLPLPLPSLLLLLLLLLPLPPSLSLPPFLSLPSRGLPSRLARSLPAFDFNIARCLDRLERYEDAVAAYRRYLAASPDASGQRSATAAPITT